MISSHSVFRITSLVLMLLAWKMAGQQFGLFVMFAGFVHYALAIVYSRRQLSATLSTLRSAVPAVLITAAGALLFWLHFSIIIFFGLHHVFNEVYLLQREVLKGAIVETKKLRLWSMVLNTLIYCTALRSYHCFGLVDSRIWFCLLLVASVCFFSVLLQMRNRLSARQLADSCAFEIASFGLVLMSCVHPLDFLMFVLYHFVFWSVYSLPMVARKGGLSSYTVLHIACLAAAWCLSPIGPAHTPLNIYYPTFIRFSYLHIFMSFALSSAQPSWLNRLFQVGSQFSPHPRGNAPLPELLSSSPSNARVLSPDRL